jgi:hypothetical protein
MAIRPVQDKTTNTTALDTNIVTDITLTKTIPVNTGFDQASTKSTGIVKAANMFFKILLTQKGSNPINKEEGTEFPDIFESGITDEDILFSIATEEVEAAFEQIQALQEANGVSVDEQIANVVITKFSLNQETSELEMDTSIYVASGEKTTLQLPSIVVS